MKELEIIILAAGFGTRMRSKKAKMLHKLCGKEMILHTLKSSFELTDNVSVVLGFQADEIAKVILNKYKNVKIYRQNLKDFPGTAGALKDIEFSCKKTLILCGDMPLIDSVDLMRLSHCASEISMSVFEKQDPFGYGRVILKNKVVENIIEEKDASEEQKLIKLVNGGCYCFSSDLLTQILPKISNNNSQQEYYLTDSIKIARQMDIQIQPIYVDSKKFMGINDKVSLSIAEKYMQDKIKKELMLSGVLMNMPETIYIDCRAKINPECEIEQNVRIVGECEINNSILKANSVIEDSKIYSSEIGPLAHIRPNCEIKSSKIGNFVELKNAKLNEVKASHLSYLGDCEIESGTNIGCGCITCNYDGKNKFKTKIGKNVFIGSDTQLVAPVTIEDDVLIAAGSTITKDVKKGSLAISRVKQTNKENFFYHFFKEKK